MCRARVAHTQCSPTVFVIFLSTMAEAWLTTPMLTTNMTQLFTGGVPADSDRMVIGRLNTIEAADWARGQVLTVVGCLGGAVLLPEPLSATDA